MSRICRRCCSETRRLLNRSDTFRLTHRAHPRVRTRRLIDRPTCRFCCDTYDVHHPQVPWPPWHSVFCSRTRPRDSSSLGLVHPRQAARSDRRDGRVDTWTLQVGRPAPFGGGVGDHLRPTGLRGEACSTPPTQEGPRPSPAKQAHQARSAERVRQMWRMWCKCGARHPCARYEGPISAPRTAVTWTAIWSGRRDSNPRPSPWQ